MLYKKDKTLVGARQTSVFRDQYFFQDMPLHMPHRSTNDFDIPGVEKIPQVIRYFVCALHHRGSVWMNEENIRSLFDLQAHKSWYVANILAHIQSLKDFVQRYPPSVSGHILDPKKQLVVSLVKRMLNKRKNHYESIGCALDGFDSDDENEEHDEDLLAGTDCSSDETHVHIECDE